MNESKSQRESIMLDKEKKNLAKAKIDIGRHYDDVFEMIPKGLNHAIFAWELGRMLKYEFNITPYEEALRVIRAMQADGYLIMEFNGMFYRPETFEDISDAYGYPFARSIWYSDFWYF